MARMIVVVKADLEVKRYYIFAHHPMHLSLLPVFSKKKKKLPDQLALTPSVA